MKIRNLLIVSLLLVIFGCQSHFTYKQVSKGLNVSLPDGTLGIYPVSDNAVRVKFFKGKPAALTEFVLK